MKLNEVFSDYLVNGIFTYFPNAPNFIVPWGSIANDLNLIYFGNHSGEKQISPVLKSLLNQDKKLDNDTRQLLANSIVSMYGKNWLRLWEVRELEYNPIENYRMQEEGTDDTTNTGTQTNNLNVTHGEKVEFNHNENVESQGNVWGFNSDTSTPTDTGTQITEGDNSETHSGTDVNSATRTDDLKQNLSHKLTRSGNIGVTTSQQMAQSSVDFWKWDFFESVFSDIDKILTSNFYESEV